LARRGIVLLAAVASITTACRVAPSVVNGCPQADYKPLFELSARISIRGRSAIASENSRDIASPTEVQHTIGTLP
jgi:hypothetical protein